MRRLLILLCSVTLLAAACGDDDAAGDDDVAADDTAAGDDDAADGDAADGDADATADDDADDAADGDDDGDDLPTGDGVGSDFCSTYNDSTEEFVNPFLLSPDEVEDWYRTTLSEIDGVRGSAPGEIRDDVDTVFASFVDLVDALEDVDWNFAAVDQTDPVFDNPEADAASSRIDAFCDDGSDDDELPDDLPGLDVEDLEDLQDQFENADPEEIGLQFYELLGHDEETARCLLDELGADFDFDDAGGDIMTQEFCGLTIFQILGGGLGG